MNLIRHQTEVLEVGFLDIIFQGRKVKKLNLPDRASFALPCTQLPHAFLYQAPTRKSISSVVLAFSSWAGIYHCDYDPWQLLKSQPYWLTLLEITCSKIITHFAARSSGDKGSFWWVPNSSKSSHICLRLRVSNGYWSAWSTLRCGWSASIQVWVRQA